MNTYEFYFGRAVELWFRATAEISSDPSDPNASTKTEDDSRRRDDDDAARIRRFAISREDAFGSKFEVVTTESTSALGSG